MKDVAMMYFGYVSYARLVQTKYLVWALYFCFNLTFLHRLPLSENLCRMHWMQWTCAAPVQLPPIKGGVASPIGLVVTAVLT
jgi:hypothetical protein